MPIKWKRLLALDWLIESGVIVSHLTLREKVKEVHYDK